MVLQKKERDKMEKLINEIKEMKKFVKDTGRKALWVVDELEQVGAYQRLCEEFEMLERLLGNAAESLENGEKINDWELEDMLARYKDNVDVMSYVRIERLQELEGLQKKARTYQKVVEKLEKLI